MICLKYIVKYIVRMKKVGWLGLRVGAAFISISRSISRSSFADPGRSEEPIADAVDIAAPSVVNIQVDIAVARILAGQSSGSGFVLNKEGPFIYRNECSCGYGS